MEATQQPRRQKIPLHNNRKVNSSTPRPPLAELKGQYLVSAAIEAKLLGLLMNPRITGPVHLGTELAKVLFTEEVAVCTLEHLIQYSDVNTLSMYCEAAATADGYPNMKKLVKKMMDELQHGGLFELCIICLLHPIPNTNQCIFFNCSSLHTSE